MASQTQHRPAYDPPRFSLARWSIFAILILAYMLVFFHRMAPAVVAADLMRTFGITGAALGSLAALLEVYSWRTVFVALGVGTLFLAVLTLLAVRNRPEDLGFPSVRQMEGQPAHHARQQHWRRQLRGVVTTRAVWPAFWVDLGMVGSMLAFVGLWAIPYLRDVHGLERSAAAAYTTLALAGFALGSLGAGWFSDRIGRRRPVIVAGTIGYALTCATFALLPWTSPLAGMALFASLGFCSGGFIVTFAAAKEVVPPASAGMAVGLVNTGLFLGAAGMQPLFGWAMDLFWQGAGVNGDRVYAAGDYRLGFLLMLGFALLAVVGATRVRETLCRNLTVGH